jgi:5'-3' exonuclease
MTRAPRALLIDGMAVLVRAARASLRMKELSWQGTRTGPLLLFTGTLVNHLSAGPWDYAVVAWEGVPSLNWRLDLYQEYKSGRLPAHGLSETAHRDEEVAREFCMAGGLHQDWAPEFEGDDIIAAWWAALREQVPGVQVKILTSDRDLLQLADKDTLWQSWLNEPLGAHQVLSSWGTEPERLPLLRAIAGDSSDGIPGLPGIGVSKALLIANRAGTPAEVIHSIGESFGPLAALHVDTWYRISNLRTPEQRPVIDTGPECERARWHPEKHAAGVREVLGRYGMARMAARQAAGKLPWPPDS